FQRCVEEERDRGRTILLSSHILSEVEELCDRVSIIRKGRTVESGSLADLRHLTHTIVSAELVGAPNGLAALPGVHDLAVQHIQNSQGTRVRLQVETDQLNAVLRSLTESGVRSLTSKPPPQVEHVLAPAHEQGGAFHPPHSPTPPPPRPRPPPPARPAARRAPPPPPRQGRARDTGERLALLVVKAGIRDRSVGHGHGIGQRTLQVGNL
ncbi:hypothetical protein ACFWI9_14775, partial [Streptomyces sp. NPDC127084]